MDLRVAVLADGANEAPVGKLNILGAFDTIFAASFPTVYPMFCLALRFRVSGDDAEKQHRIRVSFRDEDGTEVGRADTLASVPAMAPGEVGHANSILTFAGIQFRKAGHYFFDVTINGEPKARVDLMVKPRP